MTGQPTLVSVLATGGEQIHLLFQPIVNLATGQMGRAEALLGCQQPEWGMLQSALAAKTLRARWPHFQVHVNFSATQVLSSGFSLPRLVEVTQAVGIPPAALVLGFTESMLIEQESRLHHFLVEAAAAGFQLSINDFGSGCSSLAYLQRFEFNYVKIDKSLVEAAWDAANKRDLCAAIVSLGHAMDVELVAEGIATTEECHRLAGLGCHWGQGSLFGRPMELSVMLEPR